LLEERSAGVVIYRDGGAGPSFLLLNYPSGHWDFAKGKIEGDETELQAAVREAAEETGIRDLRFVDGFEEAIEYDFEHRGVPIHKQVVFFLAETRTDRVELSDEHVGYAWMSLEEAQQRVTFENARAVLAGAGSHLPRADS